MTLRIIFSIMYIEKNLTSWFINDLIWVVNRFFIDQKSVNIVK